jgi:hypothetical protein
VCIFVDTFCSSLFKILRMEQISTSFFIFYFSLHLMPVESFYFVFDISHIFHVCVFTHIIFIVLTFILFLFSYTNLVEQKVHGPQALGSRPFRVNC